MLRVSCLVNTIFLVLEQFISLLSPVFMLGISRDEKFLSAVYLGGVINLLVLPKH